MAPIINATPNVGKRTQILYLSKTTNTIYAMGNYSITSKRPALQTLLKSNERSISCEMYWEKG